jgi:hypothetical protein
MIYPSPARRRGRDAIDTQAVRHWADDQNAAVDALQQGFLAGKLACRLAAGEVAPMHVVAGKRASSLLHRACAFWLAVRGLAIGGRLVLPSAQAVPM